MVSRSGRVALIAVAAFVMVAVVAVLMLRMSGCSRKVPPVAATGEVKLDGKPLGEATVMFWPTTDDVEARGRYAIGTTDAAGRFTLKNAQNEDGIEPGRYRVTFSKVVGPDGKVIVSSIKPAESGARTTKQLVPDRYLTRDETPEVVEISAERAVVNFDLKSSK